MSTEIDVLEGEEVATRPPASSMNLYKTDDPAEILARATEIANVLAPVIRQRKLTTVISGREHVRVEGWTLLAALCGVFPVIEWTHELPTGYEARCVVRTASGAEIGAAEAMCVRSERSWASRDAYALRSMAQTRAVSKAVRGPLGFIMQLAGYDPTPAEEMEHAAPKGKPVNPEPGPDEKIRPGTWKEIVALCKELGEIDPEWSQKGVRERCKQLGWIKERPREMTEEQGQSILSAGRGVLQAHLEAQTRMAEHVDENPEAA